MLACSYGAHCTAMPASAADMESPQSTPAQAAITASRFVTSPRTHFDAERRELRILAAAEAADAIAARDELLDDVTAEESAAAGD